MSPNGRMRSRGLSRLDVIIDYGAGYIRIGVVSATGVFDLAARIGEERRVEHAW